MQLSTRRRWSPRLHLFIAALLVSFFVQPGNLGSVDTARRLQVTHSFWLNEPPVKPGEYPAFGNIGRNGVVHAWYGIGQSLLMLPADIISTTAIGRLKLDPVKFDRLRNLGVAYLTFPIFSALAVLLAYDVLILLAFAPGASMAGAFSLLFATTFLQYVQISQENNQIAFLTIAGFWGILRWIKFDDKKSLVFAACCLGFSLLIRIPNIANILCVWFFGLLAIVAGRRDMPADQFRAKLKTFALIVVPIFLVFVAFDRLYQFARFGSFFSTYMPMPIELERKLHPDLPASYPFNNPFWVGFTGPFFSLNKSVFLFDPLLLFSLALIVRCWNRLDKYLRFFAISCGLMLLMIVTGYARYVIWTGDNAWGDRFTTVPVDLLAMLALPLLYTYRHDLRRIWAWAGYAVACIAVVVQIASMILMCNVEIAQLDAESNVFSVIGRRFYNLYALATHQFHTLGLDNNAYVQDPRMTQPNFAPFIVGYSASPHAAHLAIVLWLLAGLPLLCYLAWVVRRFYAGGLACEKKIESSVQSF